MTRLNRRLLLGAIAVLLPALAGCEAGLNAPTLEFHPASSGVSTTVNGITVDNLFVLGAPVGSALPPGGRAGVFLALESENGDRLVSVSAPGTASSVKLTGGPVDLPAQTLVDLGGPVPQDGAHRAGQSAQRRGDGPADPHLRAGGGGRRSSVPVEPHAYDYATYFPPPIPRPNAVGQAQGARVRLGLGQRVGVGLGVGQRIRQPVDHAVAGGVRTQQDRSAENLLSRTDRRACLSVLIS